MNLSPRGWFGIALVILIVAATAWAVSFKPEPPADFTFVNDTEIESIDPAIPAGQPEMRVITALFEGLVNWDPKTLAPIPGVATNWEISADQLTYTFHLRKEAKWTDGSPVTAGDFVWQWRRILDPATVGKYSYQLWYIKNAERYGTKQFDLGDSVEVELHQQPKNSLPFARGEMVRGKLIGKISIDDLQRRADDSGKGRLGAADTSDNGKDKKDQSPQIYLVQTGGGYRLFQPVRTRDIAGWTAPQLNPQSLVELKDDKGAALVADTKALRVESCKDILLDFNEVGVKALDDQTLQVELRSPTPFFLFLTGYYPLFATNPHCVETYGYPGWTKPEHLVNNGPFKLQSRRVRDRIRLVKNDTYWNAANVKLNTVDVLAVESLGTSLNLYLTGQVDWIDKPPVTAVPELLKAKWLGFDPQPGMIVYFYRLNCSKPPLDNPLVRKALGLAVNKQEIVNTVTRGGEVPALSIVPPGMGGYEPATMGKYDPEKARKLLADAGYPGGRGFPKIDILYNTEEAHQSIAELIQAQWKDNLGIEVGLQNMEWNAYQAAQENLQYQVARAAWGGDYVDPNTFLDLWTTSNPNNQTGWSSKKYDSLITSAAFVSDPDKRHQIFHEAESLFLNDMPVIPIYYYIMPNVVRPYVKGFYANPIDVHPVGDIWIDQAEKRKCLESGGHG